MKRLSRKDTVPPGGFKYFVKATKTWLKAPDWKTIVQRARGHHQANGIDIPENLPELIEDQLCAALPPGHCNYEDGQPVVLHRTSLGFAEVIRGTATLGDWLIHGKKLVPDAEANRRAAICAACPFNREIEGCTSCNANALHSIANRVTGGRNAAFAHQLNACWFCGCSNRAQVWLPLDILQRHLPEELNGQLPDQCWKKRPDTGSEPPLGETGGDA